MGHWGQGKMGTHQQKKLDDDALLAFRDRFALPLSDDDVHELCASTSRPTTARRCSYLHARRAGARRLPAGARRRRRRALAVPRARRVRDASAKARPAASSRRRWCSCSCWRSCCATRRSASTSCRSSPTRRAPSACRRCSARSAIYSSVGQLYEPEDRDELLYYKEAKDGQILEEGITEAGAISLVDRRGDQLQRARRADAAVLHLLLDVRLPARRRPDLGGGATRARAASCSAPPPAARRSPAKGLQHQDGSSHLLRVDRAELPRLRSRASATSSP